MSSFSAMYYCDSDLMRGKHTGDISVQRYAAQLYVFGYNIHNLFDSPFWKNHDVVVIENTISKEKIILDPTLYDYTGIGFVKERK